MGQAKNQPRRTESQAFAKARHIRGSDRKLNLVAAMIRGKAVQQALVELQFSPRRMAREVKKVLESAIANAENNHGLDVDRLFVKTAVVGKTLVMKRFHARGRGRSSSIEKPFSNLTIYVEEAQAGAPKKAAAQKAPAKKDAAGKKPAAAKTAAGDKPKAKTKAAAGKTTKTAKAGKAKADKGTQE